MTQASIRLKVLSDRYFQSHSDKVFQEIYEQVQPFVNTLVSRVCYIGLVFNKDELLQDIRLGLWRALESYDSTKCSDVVVHLFQRMKFVASTFIHNLISVSNKDKGRVSLYEAGCETAIDPCLNSINVIGAKQLVEQLPTMDKDLISEYANRTGPAIDLVRKHNTDSGNYHRRISRIQRNMRSMTYDF